MIAMALLLGVPIVALVWLVWSLCRMAALSDRAARRQQMEHRDD